jgi:hypothetical protein
MFEFLNSDRSVREPHSQVGRQWGAIELPVASVRQGSIRMACAQ